MGSQLLLCVHGYCCVLTTTARPRLPCGLWCSVSDGNGNGSQFTHLVGGRMHMANV